MRFALLLSVAACLGAQSFDPKMPDGVPAVSGKVMEAATLRHIDVKAGDGAVAAPGKEFTVHYTGWLRDGTKFDSSLEREPLSFVQGRRQVIAGWDVGFEGMKVGGKRRLFIPYQFAYGELGRGSIPPKAELVFDVELLGVKDAAPAPAPTADLLLPFSAMEKQVMALAQAVPEDKYNWRPAPGVRSFREVFLHIAYGNQLLVDIAGGLKGDELSKRIEVQMKSESEALSKEQVLQKLTAGFATVRSTLEGARAAALTREVSFFGTATTQRGVLASLDTHIAEHLGQAIAYARMNGIVPPWSK
jgi:peptidylprolyl isomerase